MEDARIPIEELVQFPTHYTFKAIGHHTLPFASKVLKAARDVLGEQRRIDMRTRLSSKAAYLSVTLVARLENADELRNVYSALRTVSEVITVL